MNAIRNQDNVRKSAFANAVRTAGSIMGAAALGVALAASPVSTDNANAWGRGHVRGFYGGFVAPAPLYYGYPTIVYPPVYPPVYVAPQPPVYYTPPPVYATQPPPAYYYSTPPPPAPRPYTYNQGPTVTPTVHETPGVKACHVPSGAMAYVKDGKPVLHIGKELLKLPRGVVGGYVSGGMTILTDGEGHAVCRVRDDKSEQAAK